MKRFHAPRMFLALLAGGLPPALLAAPPNRGELPDPPAAPTAGPKPENAHAPLDFSGLAAIPQMRTDPFRISYLMQQKALAGTQGPRFVPLRDAQTPSMTLRGLIDNRLALLEVEGAGVYLVREGDTLSLSRQGQNTVMKIEKIDRLSLMVKMGTLEEVIVVR